MYNPAKYDLYSQDFKTKAYKTFAAMREHDPILHQVGLDGQTAIWFFSRHEDVDAILRDKRFVRDHDNAVPPERRYQRSALEALIDNHMLNKDGEDHRRLRSLVSQAFTPRRIELLKPRIAAISQELIEAALSKGEMDVIADFSGQLPTIVILEMLGIPTRDRERLRQWSQVFLEPASDGGQKFYQSAQEFIGYLQALVQERRQNPQDDLMSALIQAEEAGDQLNEEELFSTFVLLIIAGHETTMNLIANAILALTQNEDALQELRQHPERMKDAVEEFLRFDAPVERALNRFAAEDIDYKGRKIKRGHPIILILGSANHDALLFKEADKLDLEREKNPHLSFGKGVHYCLGAPLARLEAEIALNGLLQNLPGLRLAVPKESLRWRNTPGFKGLEALPIRWEG